jgi:pentapeptide MXKDX repeat protein
MKPLFAALIVSGLVFTPAAFAADAMKPHDTKMDKDAMSKPSDKMEKTGGMMDKKDDMAKDTMSKGMKKDGMSK